MSRSRSCARLHIVAFFFYCSTQCAHCFVSQKFSYDSNGYFDKCSRSLHKCKQIFTRSSVELSRRRSAGECFHLHQSVAGSEFRLTEPITETATFEFERGDLDAATPGEAILSSRLHLAGHDWQVLVYPGGQAPPPPPWLAIVAAVDEALGPSNRRVGRVGVYLRYLAPDPDAFVDAVFSLEMV
jgi:hypothetical protein